MSFSVEDTTYWRITDTGDFRNDNDTGRIQLGDGDDLQLYHDGSNSYIDNGTGDLYIRGNGDDLILKAADDVFIDPNDGDSGIKVLGEGAVKLFYDGGTDPKLATTSTGIDVTGNITATGSIDAGNQVSVTGGTPRITFTETGLTDIQNDADHVWYILLDGRNLTFRNEVTSSPFPFQLNGPTGGAEASVTFNGDVSFSGASNHANWDKSENYLNLNNDSKSVFCSNAGLQIYHDGSNGYITNSTGNLTVDGVDVAKLDALAYCNLNKTSATENINVDGDTVDKVPIKWDNKVYKSATYTHDHTDADTRQTIKVGSAGLYMINVTVGHDNTGGSRITPNMSIHKNGTEITETKASSYGRGANYGDERAMQINTVLQLAANDELDVRAWCPYTQHSQAVNTIAGECEFIMTRLAGGVEAE